ncbi:hypothetical protein RI367_004873 [Sorochytrium milnesiophthora]
MSLSPPSPTTAVAAPAAAVLDDIQTHRLPGVACTVPELPNEVKQANMSDPTLPPNALVARDAATPLPPLTEATAASSHLTDASDKPTDDALAPTAADDTSAPPLSSSSTSRKRKRRPRVRRRRSRQAAANGVGNGDRPRKKDAKERDKDKGRDRAKKRKRGSGGGSSSRRSRNRRRSSNRSSSTDSSSQDSSSVYSRSSSRSSSASSESSQSSDSSSASHGESSLKDRTTHEGSRRHRASVGTGHGAGNGRREGRHIIEFSIPEKYARTILSNPSAISFIERQSGARVKFASEPHNGERMITIRGSKDDVESAHEMVEEELALAITLAHKTQAERPQPQNDEYPLLPREMSGLPPGHDAAGGAQSAPTSPTGQLASPVPVLPTPPSAPNGDHHSAANAGASAFSTTSPPHATQAAIPQPRAEHSSDTQAPSGSSASRASAGVSRTVEIPGKKMGVVIGRGGGNIKILEKQTGARLNVDHADKHAAFRRVFISGSASAVDSAEALIHRVCEEGDFILLDPESASRPLLPPPPPLLTPTSTPAPGLPLVGRASLPPIPSMPPPAHAPPAMPMTPSSHGKHTAPKSSGRQYELPPYRHHDQHGSRSGHGNRSSPLGGGVVVDANGLPRGHGQPLRDVLTIPQNCVGFVIGKGGQTIKEFQDKAHCQIKMEPAESTHNPANMRLVHLTADDPNAIQIARKLIMSKVDDNLASRRNGGGSSGYGQLGNAPGMMPYPQHSPVASSASMPSPFSQAYGQPGLPQSMPSMGMMQPAYGAVTSGLGVQPLPQPMAASANDQAYQQYYAWYYQQYYNNQYAQQAQPAAKPLQPYGDASSAGDAVWCIWMAWYGASYECAATGK